MSIIFMYISDDKLCAKESSVVKLKPHLMLPEVLEEVEYFLKSIGYGWDGVLDIVDEE